MKQKTFILLKDLPDSKAGDEYIWDSVDEVYYKNGSNTDSWWRRKEVEDSPLWFKLKEDKIEVIIFEAINSSGYLYGWNFFVSINQKDKYPSIKKAIEAVLNDEPVKVYMNFDVVNAPRKYSEKELLDAEQRAFKEARLAFASSIKEPCVWKYEDFNDYKNSTK